MQNKKGHVHFSKEMRMMRKNTYRTQERLQSDATDRGRMLRPMGGHVYKSHPQQWNLHTSHQGCQNCLAHLK